MIQAYEKLCVEKSDLEMELGENGEVQGAWVLEGVTLAVCLW